MGVIHAAIDERRPRSVSTALWRGEAGVFDFGCELDRAQSTRRRRVQFDCNVVVRPRSLCKQVRQHVAHWFARRLHLDHGYRQHGLQLGSRVQQQRLVGECGQADVGCNEMCWHILAVNVYTFGCNRGSPAAILDRVDPPHIKPVEMG